MQSKPKHMQISEFTGTPEEFIAEIAKVCDTLQRLIQRLSIKGKLGHITSW